MKHLLFAVFAGGVLGSVAARADGWDAFEHGGGPMTIVESSVVIHLPWGGPILHELSGEPAGCGSKPVGAPFMVLDTQMFGFPNALRFDLFELDSEFPVWGRVDRLEQCIEVAGQQITLEQTSFILNGRLTELATPVAQRCGEEPADLRIDLSDAVLSPAPKSQLRSGVWFDGQHVKELGTLGGASSEALALSDSGWIVGWAADGQGLRRAFISRDGKLEQLPLPPHLESEASSIGGDRWVSGTLVTEKGRQGFLFDLESGAVHLAELREEGASIAFHGANVWGRVAGVLTTHNQEVVPILFSAEEGTVRLDELAKLPPGFVPETVEGLSDDGSVFVSGRLNGELAHFRFSP